MDFRPELYNVVQYSLYSEGFGDPIIIEEPIGWEDDIFEINKSKKNFTTITKYSTNLEFTLVGAKFISAVFAASGFDTDIILEKKSISTDKSVVDRNYIAFLDGYTYSLFNDKVKINTLESRLNSLITTYQGENVELNNNKSLDDSDIGELDIKTALIDGKQLNLVTKWLADPEKLDFTFATGSASYAIILDNIANSDDQAFSVTNEFIDSGTADGSPDNMFYSIALDDKIFDLEIDIDIDVRGKDNPSELVLRLYNDLSDSGLSQHEFVSEESLAFGVLTDAVLNTYTITFSERKIRTLAKGHSWALVINVPGFLAAQITTRKADLIMTEDSFYELSHAQTVLPFELFERLLRIMTGRTDLLLVSDYFGRVDLGYDIDGPGAYLGISNGFWAREFNDETIVTSWNDAILSYGVANNISYAIEQKGFQEYIRIEELDYFFSSKITKLPNIVDDLKIDISKEFSYSAIDIGYEKGGDEYEEAVGLDEFNGRHSYTTPITRNNQKFEKISKYRADMSGFEFARRKSQKNFPTEDTRYDEHIFFLDMKKGDTEILLQRKWQDDYAAAPENIYSPETATNLRLSPKQLLIKHGWFIKNCLTKYTDKNIHFISATGNSQMILNGVQENDNYLINLFDKEKFLNLEIEFTHQTSQEIAKVIDGNVYGRIEIIDDKGNIFRFRLFDYSKNQYKGLLIDGI